MRHKYINMKSLHNIDTVGEFTDATYDDHGAYKLWVFYARLTDVIDTSMEGDDDAQI